MNKKERENELFVAVLQFCARLQTQTLVHPFSAHNKIGQGRNMFSYFLFDFFFSFFMYG